METTLCRVKYDISHLKITSVRDEFELQLKNKFEVLQELHEEEERSSIQANWQIIKETLRTVCQEVVGTKKHHHKEWITADTLGKIEERKQKKRAINNSRTRAAKAKAQVEYTEAHRAVKKSIRKDKKDCINGLAAEAEQAAHNGNMKQLYDYSKPERPVKDKEGKTISVLAQQMNRWSEHFEELLNRPAPPNPPDINPADEDLPISCDKPTREEIRKAITCWRTGRLLDLMTYQQRPWKQTWTCQWKCCIHSSRRSGRKKRVPTDWKEGYLTKLPKKGDLSNCNNYRGVTTPVSARQGLQSDPPRADEGRRRSTTTRWASWLPAEPIMHRPDCNSAHHSRAVFGVELINFVDYEQAFDSVDREVLWKLLRYYDIPFKMVNLIKSSYEGMTCRVIHAGQLTTSFRVNTGVRQGCLLSPFLFLIAIDWIMKTSTSERRNGIQWTLWSQLDDLDFADNLALLSHSHQQMQEKTSVLAATSAQVGLIIHKEKTKILKTNVSNINPITLNGCPLEEVQSFTYLGSIIDQQGGTDADVKARIGKARVAFIQLKNIWASRELTLTTKIRLFNSNVKSVLLYGAETWRTTKVTNRKIQTFINSCLRRILHIRWPDTITIRRA